MSMETALMKTERAYLSPALSLEEFKQQLAALKEFTAAVLVEGVDYGTIPGTPKPTLLKPGAEKLLRNYGLVVDGRILPESKQQIADGIIDITIEGTVRSIRTGEIFGTVHANCNSDESRYYNARQPQAKKQQRLGDQKNVVLKMVDKRVWVAAALLYTLASEIFTQDIEDVEPPEEQKPNGFPCPKDKGGCGDPHSLVIREGLSKKTGKRYSFWGCSNYPKCEYTQNDAPEGSTPHLVQPQQAALEPPTDARPSQRREELLIEINELAERLKLRGKAYLNAVEGVVKRAITRTEELTDEELEACCKRFAGVVSKRVEEQAEEAFARE